MDGTAIVEWLGCWTGLAGAALLAINCRYSGYGWWFFLASNLCWITFAVVTDVEGLGYQHIGFMATSLLGLYRWRVTDKRPSWQEEKTI